MSNIYDRLFEFGLLILYNIRHTYYKGMWIGEV